MPQEISLNSATVAALRTAIQDPRPESQGIRRTKDVSEFYRYPARFSSTLANAVIAAFTEPGDTVLDPFVGGGTTAVESVRIGRGVVGSDINFPLKLSL